MRHQASVVNELDQSRLRAVIDQLRVRHFYTPWENGDELQSRLERATVLAPPKVPDNLVTMNSIVHVRDIDKDKEQSYTLVFPEDSDPMDGKISVLSKLGLALFGARVGEEVAFSTPGGLRRIEVLRLQYQPEAAQDWTR